MPLTSIDMSIDVSLTGTVCWVMSVGLESSRFIDIIVYIGGTGALWLLARLSRMAVGWKKLSEDRGVRLLGV